jgi:DNA-binding transcriptional LysR family regulator
LKDAVIGGNGVLLSHDVLAYDDLRTGRLVIPFNLTLRSSHSYYVVCEKRRQNLPNILAFRTWIKQEIFALDWKKGFPGRRS